MWNSKRSQDIANFEKYICRDAVVSNDAKSDAERINSICKAVLGNDYTEALRNALILNALIEVTKDNDMLAGLVWDAMASCM